MKWLAFIVFSVVPFIAFSQETQLRFSDKYPLKAHIISIETEQEQNHVSGDISTRRLMKTEIEGKTYLLVAARPPLEERPFEHPASLNAGFYPARRTKHGFEFEYQDGDKVRHEELRIMLKE